MWTVICINNEKAQRNIFGNIRFVYRVHLNIKHDQKRKQLQWKQGVERSFSGVFLGGEFVANSKVNNVPS